MTAHESHEFTPLQGAAIDCMVAGMVNKQIADAIGTSVDAVGRIIDRARRKAKARTREQLVAMVMRRGLV